MARVRVQVPVESQQPADTHHREIKIPRIDARKAMYIVGALAIVITLFVLINDRNHLRNELKKDSSQSQNDTQKYQNEVARLVDVPTGVTPQIKIPSDSDLKQLVTENPIYKSTQAGDVFLVYPQANNSLFVVIYRPSTQKIILATQGSQNTTTTKP